MVSHIKRFLRWLWSGFTVLGEGFASIGEGFASIGESVEPKELPPPEPQWQTTWTQIRRAEGMLTRTQTLREKEVEVLAKFDEEMRQCGVEDFEIGVLRSLNLSPLEYAKLGLLISAAKIKNRRGSEVGWWKDLGLQTRPTSLEEARRAYNQAMLKAHPDHGGTPERMVQVKVAWREAKKAFEAGECSRGFEGAGQ